MLARTSVIIANLPFATKVRKLPPCPDGGTEIKHRTHASGDDVGASSSLIRRSKDRQNRPLQIIHRLDQIPVNASVSWPSAFLIDRSRGRRVGTAVAGGPPHRSVREELPHTAPALSRARNRWSGYGWRMRGTGDASLRRSIRSQVQRCLPRLAASSNRAEPETSHLVDELVQPAAVARNGMIVQPSPHDARQPAARFAQGSCIRLRSFSLIACERRTHAFRHREWRWEPSRPRRVRTLVREAEKVERLGPPLAASFSSFDRIAAELDQTRFPFVQLQAELGETYLKCVQARRRLAVVLETDHEVIRITYHNHIATAAVFPPPLDPQVEHVVQVHVRRAAVISPLLAAFLRSSSTIRRLH